MLSDEGITWLSINWYMFQYKMLYQTIVKQFPKWQEVLYMEIVNNVIRMLTIWVCQ